MHAILIRRQYVNPSMGECRLQLGGKKRVHIYQHLHWQSARASRKISVRQITANMKYRACVKWMYWSEKYNVSIWIIEDEMYKVAWNRKAQVKFKFLVFVLSYSPLLPPVNSGDASDVGQHAEEGPQCWVWHPVASLWYCTKTNCWEVSTDWYCKCLDD